MTASSIASYTYFESTWGLSASVIGNNAEHNVNLTGPWLQPMPRQKCDAQHDATKAKTNAKANAKPPPAA
eukprot:7101445-Prorocentrum_lima.AAC.1